MKKLAIIAAMLFVAFTVSAQNATQTKDGNYTAIKRVMEAGKATGKTYTDLKGNVYPVYESKNGKLYVERTSKSGNVYRMYLKVN